MSAPTTAETGAPVETRRPRRAAHARTTDTPPAARPDRPHPRRHPRFAPHTVRARIVCLLALPVVSLTSLWGIAAVDTIGAAFNQSQLRTLDASVAMPLDDAVDALQAERSAAIAYLAVPGAEPTLLSARMAASRAAFATLQTGIDESAAAADNLDPALSGRLRATAATMSGLTGLRATVLDRSASVAGAQHAYTAAVDDAFAVQSTLASATGAPSGAQQAVALSEAREQLAQQDAVLAAAYAAGSLNQAGYQQFVGAVYAERAYLQQASATLADPTRTAAGADLTRLQNAVLAAGPGAQGADAAPATAWGVAAPSVLAELDSAERAASTPVSIDPYRRLLTTGSGFGVLLGLFALVASLLISVGIGRRLVTDLVGLRDYALDLAGRRLPETMARLRAGQRVEPAEQAPPLDPDAGELGQVADALAVASRAAMQAAVERAELVSGVSGVFLSLARRSQVLVHRQLALLDAMERRTEEPDHLEDLFRLDHLATRMRRHAEGLIILSGATPGRAWRNPVDLTDVVRAAAAEAEDYPRVEVRRMPRARVLGPVVGDLTHLLAELIENATSFSPPHTRVVVGGEPVGSGFAIEIEDRGLGMSQEALHEANRRIGESSGDDLFDSDRLGLFVVSRLARRHEVRVSLCASAYGGITAVVLIPSGVMQPPGEPGEAPLAEHDLGVSGALPHGPLAGPGRTAIAEAEQDPHGNGKLIEIGGRAERDAPGGNGIRGERDPQDGREILGTRDVPGVKLPPLDRRTPRSPIRGAFAQPGPVAAPLPGAPTPASTPAPAPVSGGAAAPTAPGLPGAWPGLEAAPEPAAVARANGHAPAAAAESTAFADVPPPLPAPAVPKTHDPAEIGGELLPATVDDGLPHRVRQANLAPQLRRESPPGHRTPTADAPTGPRPVRPPRSPEQNRATMSAFQRGFNRGRGEEPAAPPAPPTAPSPAAEAGAARPADHHDRGEGSR
ncbi:MAG TPA: nitrate- and nitrite sensing domain-containing protein [Actinospica sp.]|jgi:signal transduction histidine kinase|nr:nitrate- and nitrite sensing domain-containing protein [Actinospica sp.]